MKLLHTSDWHLGRYLYTKRRYDEFERFLDWLLAYLDRERIDCLVVAGDVFDTTTPSPKAQQLYFEFLANAVKTGCRHIVIVAGNHDSPSLLDAPGLLLKTLNIHVVSQGGRAASQNELPLEKVFASDGRLLHEKDSRCSMSAIQGGDPNESPDKFEKEILLLRDQAGEPELIVCAVPFLRDQDVRKSKPSESWEEKRQNHIEGIREHYRRVAEEALRLRERLAAERPDAAPVPIVATGHLFTAGGRTADGDAVRELFVGSLGGVPANVFPPCFDYVALGHLHLPQIVDGSERIRYSGSPLPMGFGELNREKFLLLVQLSPSDDRKRIDVDISSSPIPCFQRLVQLKGDWEKIESGINNWKNETDSEPIWLEIDYDGELIGDLHLRIDRAVADSRLEVLRTVNRPRMVKERLLGDFREPTQNLSDFSVEETFQQCMESSDISKDRHGDILNTFRAVLLEMETERTK